MKIHIFFIYMRLSGRRKDDSYQKFTLIELLIVIAIISILSGLLLPSLNQARKQAKTIACRSNLSQISQAWALYFDDYNYQLPPTSLAFPYYRWGTYLYYRLGKCNVINQNAYCRKDESGSVIRPYSPFDCPEQQTLGEYGHFSRNLYLTGVFNNYNLKLIQMPSRRCFISDGIYMSGIVSAGVEQLTYESTDFRHSGLKANFLFLDGHSEGKGRSHDINYSWNNYFWGQNCNQ